MTFLNWTILLCLVAVGIPILIHLLNRRRAKAVQWGAMRFLLASLASRNRRIILEELLLMLLRCLLVAFLVLAVARPYVPSRAGFGAAVVLLPAVLLAAMLAGVGAVLRSRRKLRWGLWASAALLLSAAIWGGAHEQDIQRRFWQGGGEKDVAIILDGSSSMTLGVGGTMNFQRALDEARAVIGACKSGDAISLVLAGPVARPLVPTPSYDRKELQAALTEANAVGGSMNAADAISLAAATLETGHNVGKKIVFITDAQSAGWDTASGRRWDALGTAWRDMPQRPSLVVRTLALPPAFRNLAVTDLRPLRAVIGSDRPVRIEAVVANTGTVPMEVGGLELLVDGAVAAKRSVAKIPPNGSEKVQFDYRFDRAGYHVLTARLAQNKSPTGQSAADDDMPCDNQAQRVVYVLDRLGVLLVEGSPSPRPLEGSADFLSVAMAPRPESGTDVSPVPQTTATAGETPPRGETPLRDETPVPQTNCLIDPKVISAPDIVGVRDFSAYRLVVLANVSKLNAAAADALVKYVQAGGGLWIVPGDKADASFYNNWKDPSGLPVPPATLGTQRTVPAQGMRLAPKTFNHPVLDLLAAAGQSDASSAMLRAYWPLATGDKDPSVRVAGTLEDGTPLLVERKLGKGCVLMTAMSLDRRDCNLPALNCFVPLVHEAVYYLCGAAVPDPNVPPGAEIVLRFPPDPNQPHGQLQVAQTLPVDTPSGHRRMATVLACDDDVQASFRFADQPGLYTITLPPTAGKAAAPRLPFVVLDDAQESRMTSLSEADWSRIGRYLPVLHAQTTEELMAAVSGAVPGTEIWRMLALAALACLLMEIALTRWIALQRKDRTVKDILFGVGGVARVEGRSMGVPPMSECVEGILPSSSLFPSFFSSVPQQQQQRQQQDMGETPMLRKQAGLAALRVLVGVAVLLAGAQLAQRWLMLTTSWPIWLPAILGAAGVETVLALYRLERQTVSQGVGRTLVALRVAAVLLVVAMLAQPVWAMDLAEEIHRVVAVLVDQSASMRIGDTQLSSSDKVRLAESLWAGPQRPYRLETTARALADLQSQLRAEADALAVLSQARLDIRRRQLAVRQDTLCRQLTAAAKTLDGQIQAIDAPLRNNAAMPDAVRLALMDVKTRLSAKVAPGLTRAIAVTDAGNVDQLGAAYPSLLATLHQAAGDLAEIAPKLEGCAQGLDEGFYSSLTPEQKADVEADAGRTRIEQVRQALLAPPPARDTEDKPRSLLDRLQAKYQTKLYTFDTTVSQVPVGQASGLPCWSATGKAGTDTNFTDEIGVSPRFSQGTDLAAAMRKVLADLGGQGLAGVVVFSDGRHNAKTSIESAMRQMGLQQAPVCSVVAGSARPPTDAAIISLDAPETIYARDKMFINAQVKLDGLAGKTAHVQLYDGDALKDSRTLTVPSDSYRTCVELSDTPEAAGTHSYRVLVDKFPGEAFADNNSYPLTLGVTEDRARLLLVDQRPRWEFRYLKNLFAGRDNSVRLQYVLLEADRIEDVPPPAPVAASVSRQPDQAQAYALPVDEAEWMKFDVIILGDVAPKYLSPAQMGFMRKFVADRGGTLVIIAGENFMPQSFAGTPLEDLLPVKLAGGSRPAAPNAEPSFRIALTLEGEQHVIMRQEMDRQANNRTWASFPDLYWRCPVLGVKPGASVLAYASPSLCVEGILPSCVAGVPPASSQFSVVSSSSSSSSSSQQQKQQQDMGKMPMLQQQDAGKMPATHALVVTHRVAMGQVLFVGFDSTWRMRYRAGDTYHHKFWGQVMRWSTASKLPGAANLVKLGTDRSRYEPHAKIVVRAKIQRPDFSPFVAADVAVKVYSGRQMLLKKGLTYAADSPGLYWAELGELPGGTYRLELSAPSAKPIMDHEKLSEVTAEFSVDPSSPIEQVELSADRGLLGQIASSSGGLMAELYEAPRVLEPLGPGVLVNHEARQYTLWDRWWILAIIVAMVTAEWLLRKKAGLA